MAWKVKKWNEQNQYNSGSKIACELNILPEWIEHIFKKWAWTKAIEVLKNFISQKKLDPQETNLVFYDKKPLLNQQFNW